MSRRWCETTVVGFSLLWAVSTLVAQGQGGAQGQGPAFVAYPPRPPGDPAAIERGKGIYSVNCTFCHGAELRGGDGSGPNLLRSVLVLEDQKGEKIAPIIREGGGGMPRFALTDDQIADIAAFVHSFPVSSRSGPSTINIVVGDSKKGEVYVAATCAKCHTTAALAALAAKIDDPKMLQQMWLMPGNAGGRGGGGGGGAGTVAPIPAPPIDVTVTLESGEAVKGRLSRIDDFGVSLTQADGTHRAFRTAGTAIKVEIHDPLAPHKELLRVYTDADIHNVTAYIASLKASGKTP